MFCALPFDILFEIFLKLSVKDLCQLEQTSKCLRDCINEPCVWAERHSRQRSIYRTPQKASISGDEIRRKVVQETIVGEEWRRSHGRTTILTKLSPQYPTEVKYVSIFLGGDFVLLTLVDGAIDILPVAADNLQGKEKVPLCPSLPCENYGLQMKLTGKSIRARVSDEHGYLFVRVGHVDESDLTRSHDLHIRCYTYQLSAEPGAQLVADFTLPVGAKVHSWSLIGDSIYFVYNEPGQNPCIYQVKPEALGSPTCFPILEAALKLIQITDGAIHDDDSKYKFAMLSSRRILVISTYSVAVYDIPDSQYMKEATVGPVWRWPAKVDNNPHNFHSGGRSYIGFSTSPIVWVFDSYTHIHSIRFSESGSPVEKHDIFPLKYPGHPAIARMRAIWIHRSRRSLMRTVAVYTLSLQDPPSMGCFNLSVEEGAEGAFKSCFTFDDISGRVAMIVGDASGQTCVYVASIPRLS